MDRWKRSHPVFSLVVCSERQRLLETLCAQSKCRIVGSVSRWYSGNGWPFNHSNPFSAHISMVTVAVGLGDFAGHFVYNLLSCALSLSRKQMTSHPSIMTPVL